MTKVYKSKIGLELVIPIGLILGITLVIVTLSKAWLGFIIILAVLVFIVSMFSTTYYIIHGNLLKIKCGFLYDIDVDIKSIRKISETKNPLSAPATSLNRLEIEYNKFDSVLISPKEKEDFVNELKKQNHAIEIKIKGSNA